jgi:hypothetical protein
MKKIYISILGIVILTACITNKVSVSQTTASISLTPFLSETAIYIPTGTPEEFLSSMDYTIPIMPGATSSYRGSTWYWFAIRKTPTEIKAYYDRELKTLGWDTIPNTVNEPDHFVFYRNYRVAIFFVEYQKGISVVRILCRYI